MFFSCRMKICKCVILLIISMSHHFLFFLISLCFISILFSTLNESIHSINLLSIVSKFSLNLSLWWRLFDLLMLLLQGLNGFNQMLMIMGRKINNCFLHLLIFLSLSLRIFTNTNKIIFIRLWKCFYRCQLKYFYQMIVKF